MISYIFDLYIFKGFLIKRGERWLWCSWNKGLVGIFDNGSLVWMEVVLRVIKILLVFNFVGE